MSLFDIGSVNVKLKFVERVGTDQSMTGAGGGQIFKLDKNLQWRAYIHAPIRTIFAALRNHPGRRFCWSLESSESERKG